MTAGALAGAESGGALCAPAGPWAFVCAAVGAVIGGAITYYGAKAVADAINNADQAADQDLSQSKTDDCATGDCEEKNCPTKRFCFNNS